MSTPHKLISFDLDDTLWAVTPVIVQAEQKLHAWLAQEHGEFVQSFSQTRIVELRAALIKAQPEYKSNLTQLRLDLMQQLFESFGYSANKAAQSSLEAFEVFHHWRCQVDLSEGVSDLLAALSARHTLVAISNGNADIKKAGLAAFFSAHYKAEDYAAAKPAPDMFLAALNDFDVQPGELLHVGDHPVEDVHAAQQLGAQGVWFNAKQKAWPTRDAGPAYEVASITELEALFASLGLLARE